MTLPVIILDVVVVLAAAILTIVVIGALSRRLLGMRVGAIRIVLAGVVGLIAEVGFESQYVWRNDGYSPALIPVQFAIVFFVAIAFLVVAELLVPQGSVSRPDQWLPALRHSLQRGRRYAELTRIAARHRLIPFTIDTAPTLAAARERARLAASLADALEEAAAPSSRSASCCPPGRMRCRSSSRPRWRACSSRSRPRRGPRSRACSTPRCPGRAPRCSPSWTRRPWHPRRSVRCTGASSSPASGSP